MKKNSSLKTFLNGIIVENPILVMVLGTCPAIAITNKVSNALGMGLAFLFVLFFSNLIISLIRKLVPNEIRIPAYIVIIATLVTIVEMLLKAYFLPIYESLGVFVALIVVNCIILGRAEAFASQNNPGKSILDAFGMSIGFTLALFAMALIREFFGAGTITIWDGVVIDCTKWFEALHVEPIHALSDSTVGGFLVFGLLIGCVSALRTLITDLEEKALVKAEASTNEIVRLKAQIKRHKKASVVDIVAIANLKAELIYKKAEAKINRPAEKVRIAEEKAIEDIKKANEREVINTQKDAIKKANKAEVCASRAAKAEAKRQAIQAERDKIYKQKSSLPVKLTRRGSKNADRLRSSNVRKINSVQNYHTSDKKEGGK